MVDRLDGHFKIDWDDPGILAMRGSYSSAPGFYNDNDDHDNDNKHSIRPWAVQCTDPDVWGWGVVKITAFPYFFWLKFLSEDVCQEETTKNLLVMVTFNFSFRVGVL